MKMMKLTYLMAFALAVDAGCHRLQKHRPVGVTHLPQGAGSTMPDVPRAHLVRAIKCDAVPTTVLGGI